MESPTGLLLKGAGNLDDVNTTGSGASSYPYSGAGLFGIILRLGAGEDSRYIFRQNTPGLQGQRW